MSTNVYPAFEGICYYDFPVVSYGWYLSTNSDGVLCAPFVTEKARDKFETLATARFVLKPGCDETACLNYIVTVVACLQQGNWTYTLSQSPCYEHDGYDDWQDLIDQCNELHPRPNGGINGEG